MGYYPLCSYNLIVTGDNRDIVQQKLISEDIVPKYLTPMDSFDPDKALAYGIDDEKGAIERWTTMVEDITAIAVAVPQAELVMYENNEEDKSEARAIRWQNGVLVNESYARLVDPWGFDEATITEACQLLRRNGMNAAADLIHDELSGKVF